MIENCIERIKEYQPRPLGQERCYAVLLPLVWDENNQDWQILYQIRSKYISQPGEVSFPGGRVETGESFQEAAVRETAEELNITSSQIEILGEIDYFIHHGRTIRCFVGKILGDWQAIQANPDEVERLFTLPLNQLLITKPKIYHLIATPKPDSNFPFERIPNGSNYNFGKDNRKVLFYDLGGENLWGITAQFTARFIEILKDDHS
ncbi:NUDIX hydrolase [Streptococcus criceti]|uniref:Nudix hydrolase domain-containing protein n=1 Tax=Streptococcus criceti HS-6 TaxID=873449 RepID=G5JPK4_STRCG|nr:MULTISPECIES: CoA pyrophosphatase [Streptococcus]EHI75432.1 hypothetical protein STRCR_0357 [Streptococcus criceti HS-6]SUN41848.1 NUDIX hydrolase [Streptococcus criceti]